MSTFDYDAVIECYFLKKERKFAGFNDIFCLFSFWRFSLYFGCDSVVQTFSSPVMGPVGPTRLPAIVPLRKRLSVKGFVRVKTTPRS